jgi:hypothetical protein
VWLGGGGGDTAALGGKKKTLNEKKMDFMRAKKLKLLIQINEYLIRLFFKFIIRWGQSL